jgi:hypothetical protein
MYRGRRRRMGEEEEVFSGMLLLNSEKQFRRNTVRDVLN